MNTAECNVQGVSEGSKVPTSAQTASPGTAAAPATFQLAAYTHSTWNFRLEQCVQQHI